MVEGISAKPAPNSLVRRLHPSASSVRFLGVRNLEVGSWKLEVGSWALLPTIAVTVTRNGSWATPVTPRFVPWVPAPHKSACKRTFPWRIRRTAFDSQTNGCGTCLECRQSRMRKRAAGTCKIRQILSAELHKRLQIPRVIVTLGSLNFRASVASQPAAVVTEDSCV
jgi:hypothetical protein